MDTIRKSHEGVYFINMDTASDSDDILSYSRLMEQGRSSFWKKETDPSWMQP